MITDRQNLLLLLPDLPPVHPGSSLSIGLMSCFVVYELPTLSHSKVTSINENHDWQ